MFGRVFGTNNYPINQASTASESSVPMGSCTGECTGKYTRQRAPQLSIQFGKRDFLRKNLSEYGIKLVTGTIGDKVGQGNFATVYRFYPDKESELSKDKPRTWVFKPEQKQIRRKYEKSDYLRTNYPLSSDDWLYGSVRSALSYQVARRIGGPEIVETHLGISSSAVPGAVMRHVEGVNLDSWLISTGRFRKAALTLGILKDRIDQLEKLQQPYQDEEFRKVIHLALQDTDFPGTVRSQLDNIKSLDFANGQCDRSKLSNLILTLNAAGEPESVSAIDNDLSFPVLNTGFKRLKSATFRDRTSLIGNREAISAMVGQFLPESQPAFEQRITNIGERSFPLSQEHIGISQHTDLQVVTPRVLEDSGSGGLENYDHKTPPAGTVNPSPL